MDELDEFGHVLRHVHHVHPAERLGLEDCVQRGLASAPESSARTSRPEQRLAPVEARRAARMVSEDRDRCWRVKRLVEDLVVLEAALARLEGELRLDR